jgi:hypothetical protein
MNRDLLIFWRDLEEFIESNESRFTDFLEGFGNSVDDTGFDSFIKLE